MVTHSTHPTQNHPSTHDPTVGVGRLPSFLVIGAQKAGSTAIYHYLAQHPEVFMSPVKEALFFGDEGLKYTRSVRDLENYKSLFKDVSTELVWGEATPTYLWDPTAAEQIRHLIPNAQLIVILRDPVERAYSEYMFLYEQSRFSATKSQVILPLRDYGELLRHANKPILRPTATEDDPIRIRASFYASDLRRYIELFGNNQISIHLYDHLKSDPVTTMQSIFKFLGVSTEFVPDVSRKHNITQVPKNMWLDSILLKSSGIKEFFKHLIPSSFRRSLSKSIYQANMQLYPPLRPEDRAVLIEVFRQDILETQALTGCDLSAWLKV